MNKCSGCFKYTDKNMKYCNSCIKKIFFNNRHISPILDFDKKKYITMKHEMSGRFSISGVQDKISLKIENNELVPTEKGGMYILKPVPDTSIPFFHDDVPANEHLTMQIAGQIFKIKTAENALIHFIDKEPAYIVKRFDVSGDKKIAQEDFCQLIQMSEESHGRNYKYEGSYEKSSSIINKYCAASKIETEKYYFTVLFDYFFSNGDAHLKNFSLIKTGYGDYTLSPAYDLLATSLHFPNESRMALDLFENYESDSYRKNGFYKRDDFIKLAEFLNIKFSRAVKYIEQFFNKKENCTNMIERSFLSDEAKIKYLEMYQDRLKAMKD